MSSVQRDFNCNTHLFETQIAGAPHELREPRISDVRDPFFFRCEPKKSAIFRYVSDNACLETNSDTVVNVRIKDLKPVIAPAILCEEMGISLAQVHVRFCGPLNAHQGLRICLPVGNRFSNKNRSLKYFEWEGQSYGE